MDVARLLIWVLLGQINVSANFLEFFKDFPNRFLAGVKYTWENMKSNAEYAVPKEHKIDKSTTLRDPGFISKDDKLAFKNITKIQLKAKNDRTLITKPPKTDRSYKIPYILHPNTAFAYKMRSTIKPTGSNGGRRRNQPSELTRPSASYVYLSQMKNPELFDSDILVKFEKHRIIINKMVRVVS